MPSGDIHNYGQCWCGRDHQQSIWQDGYDAGLLAASKAPTPPDALIRCSKCGVEIDFHAECDFADEEGNAPLVVSAPTPLAPHPGQNHDYRMTCLRCGEPGYLFVGFHSPGETYRWSEAMPKEAE